MKLTINSRKQNSQNITSYRFIIGSRQARQLGLIDEDGDGREVIVYPAKNGILLIPIQEKLGKSSYGGYTTEICRYKDKYYGALLEDPQNRVWSAPSLDSAEDEFRRLVDKIALE